MTKSREVVISLDDLKALPEYSMSLPTGTVVGKRCRRRVPGPAMEWKIGEYVPDPDPKFIGIKWAWAVDENHEPHRGDF